MAKQFLITRPRHDKETSYLYSFSRAIVQTVKEDKTIRVRELADSKANRNEVESALSTVERTLAFFNGHGDEETVYGHKDEPIVDQKNVWLTKNKIIYALACSSLVRLGALSIQHGAQAYVGYRDEFMWVGDPSTSAIPDKDNENRTNPQPKGWGIHRSVFGIENCALKCGGLDPAQFSIKTPLPSGKCAMFLYIPWLPEHQ